MAVDAFNLAAKSGPGNSDIQNYLGYSYRHLDRMNGSFRHYNEALQLEPNHRGPHKYIGWAYLEMTQPGKVEEPLTRLEKICGKGCEEYEKLNRGGDRRTLQGEEQVFMMISVDR